MAITVMESGARERTLTSATRTYRIFGASSDQGALEAAKQAVPLELDGLFRNSVELTESTENFFTAEASWGPQAKELSAARLRTVSIDMTGGTKTVTLSMETRVYTRPGETAPNYGRAIGWDGTDAAGVEIGTGNFDVTVTRRFSEEDINQAFFRALNVQKFTTNDAAFWGWNAGEVLFRGASGNHTGQTGFSVANDAHGQLSGFALTGFRDEDTHEGDLYILIAQTGESAYAIRMYQDAACTALVAHVPSAVVGDNTVVPQGGTSIAGTVRLNAFTAPVTADNPIILTCPFPWDITYKFSFEPNVTQMLPENGLDGIEVTKGGWEYIELAAMEPEIDGADLTPALRHFRVHRVYAASDFSLLKAGASPFKGTV